MTKTARPVPVLTSTRLMQVCDVFTVIVLFATVGYVLRAWGGLPDRIPVHFNARGVADGWGGKGALVAGPIIGAAVALLLAVVSRFPHRFNYIHPITEQNAQRHYTLAREMMALLRAVFALLGAVIAWVQVTSAQAGASPTEHTILIVVLSLVGPQAVFISYLVRASRVDSPASRRR